MAWVNMGTKKSAYFIVFGVLFLLLSLWVGTISIRQQQNLQKKAAIPLCPGAEQCPVAGAADHLRSCHPGEVDGSPSESLCAWVGRVETCGPAYTKWCCPVVNGAWTTDLTMCPSANATPTPPPLPTPIAPVVIAPKGTLPCPTTSTVQISFSWNAVPNAVNYYVRIDDTSNPWSGSCTAPNPGDVCSGLISAASYTTNLAANKNYQWYVVGHTAAGVQGVPSTVELFSIPNICSTPSPTKSPSPVPTRSPSPTPSRSPSPTPTPTRSPSPTPTRSPSPSPSPIPYPDWDINRDGIINIVDIGLIIDNYEESILTNLRVDVNHDGSVDIIDIGIVLDHYTF